MGRRPRSRSTSTRALRRCADAEGSLRPIPMLHTSTSSGPWGQASHRCPAAWVLATLCAPHRLPARALHGGSRDSPCHLRRGQAGCHAGGEGPGYDVVHRRADPGPSRWRGAPTPALRPFSSGSRGPPVVSTFASADSLTAPFFVAAPQMPSASSRHPGRRSALSCHAPAPWPRPVTAPLRPSPRMQGLATILESQRSATARPYERPAGMSSYPKRSDMGRRASVVHAPRMPNQTRTRRRTLQEVASHGIAAPLHHRVGDAVYRVSPMFPIWAATNSLGLYPQLPIPACS